jgi:hypothetical protein
MRKSSQSNLDGSRPHKRHNWILPVSILHRRSTYIAKADSTMASSSSEDVNSKPSTASDDSQYVDTSTISLYQNDQPSETAKTTPSVRETVGEAMHLFSDGINNNLIAARYGVFASIVLLSAYGISNTPLFFRFRTVGEIPASYFLNRRRLYGRIIGIDKSHGDSTLQIYVRHLSPVGQILPKTWYDFFMRASPLASSLTQTRSTQKPEESRSELLRIKIGMLKSMTCIVSFEIWMDFSQSILKQPQPVFIIPLLPSIDTNQKNF